MGDQIPCPKCGRMGMDYTYLESLQVALHEDEQLLERLVPYLPLYLAEHVRAHLDSDDRPNHGIESPNSGEVK